MTDIHHDRLLSGKEKAPRTRKELGEPMPKECPACNTLKAPKVRECPTCGFTPTKQSEIEAEEGELREVTRGKPKPTMDDKQGFYSQLLAVARTRNRSKGWVSHAYKDRFKVWPRGMDEREAPPTPEVLSWVRAKDIRYAKGKGR